MIVGSVTPDRQAVFPLRVFGAGGAEVTVRAAIDTGFSDQLTLPPATITTLGLTWLMDDDATLADGSVALFSVYYCEVDWHGTVRGVTVHEADAEPLVGMELLDDSTLFVECQPGGAVEITQTLPPLAPVP